MDRVVYQQALLRLLICLSLAGGTAVSVPAARQEKTVTLKVVDRADGSPLPYSYVRVRKDSILCHTGPRAEVTLTLRHFPAEVEVSYVGYTTRTLTLRGTERRVICRLSGADNALAEVYVTGTKETYGKTANRTVVSKDLLENRQEQSMARMLSSVPGMRVLSTGALIEKPVLEGMSGSRISIIDNRTRLVGQQWGDDHAPELSIPPYATLTVEKGAQSVKYGSNAIGGIIRVDTDLNPAEQASHLGLHTSYAGNGHTYGGNAYWESSVSPDFRYRIAGKFYRAGSYSTADYLLYNTGSKLFNQNLDMAYRRHGWNVQAHLTYYDAEMGIFTGSHIGTKEDLLRRFEQGRPAPGETGNFSYRISSPKQRVQHFTAHTHAAWNAGEKDRLAAGWTFQSDYRREYELRKGTYTRLPSFAFKLNSSHLHLDWTHSFPKNSHLETGIDWLSARNISDNNTKAVPIIPNYRATEAGLYCLLGMRPGEKLSLEAGIRTDMKRLRAKGYDWSGNFYGGDKHYHSLTGSMGMKYAFSAASHIRLNLGLAWRAPEANELYSKGVHHGDAVYQEGNPDLRTEQTLKFTAGYHIRQGKIDCAANLFAHYIHHFIYSVPHYETVNGQRTPEVTELLSGTFPKYYFTQSNGIFAGGDITVRLSLSEHFIYSLGGEWIRARNLSLHTYFPEIPADRYRQTLEYRRPLARNWRLRASVTHQHVCRQRRFDPDTDLLPSPPPAYDLLNGLCAVTRTFGRHTLEVYASGSNLLNALYKDYTNRLRYFAHDKGRDVTTGIKYSF